MTPATYELVFNAGQAGYRNWWFPAFGLILVSDFRGHCNPRPQKPMDSIPCQRAIAYCGAAFSILWVLATFLGTFSDYWRLREAIRLGHFEVVEGKVVDFVPMPPEGHAMERFTVNGHHYEYSDYQVIAGFNTTQSHGGPIREGSLVRIFDVGGQIARLEIAR